MSFSLQSCGSGRFASLPRTSAFVYSMRMHKPVKLRYFSRYSSAKLRNEELCILIIPLLYSLEGGREGVREKGSTQNLKI